MQNW